MYYRRERYDNTGKTTKSSWVFRNIPLDKSVLRNVNISKPDKELEEVSGEMIMFYTRNMLPLLSAGTTLYSKLCFGEDYVVAFSQTHITLTKNALCDSLKNVVLMYRSASFVDKVLCNSEYVKVAKTDIHLYFETNKGTAFIKYDNRLPDYSQHINNFRKDHAFAIDRLYLKDILKRLKLLNESVEFTIDGENSNIVLKNDKFTQDLELLNVKDMSSVVRFKVMPEILSKAIIGSDDEFSNVLYVYYSPQPNKTAVLTFTDNSNKWFSSISIKPY